MDVWRSPTPPTVLVATSSAAIKPENTTTIPPESPATQTSNATTTARKKKRKRRSSMLHSRTVENLPLVGPPLVLLPSNESNDGIRETTERFAQHGMTTSGIHFRLQNTNLLNDRVTRENGSMLVLMILNDHTSWGADRSIDDCFQLLHNFTYPQNKASFAILTSSTDEFDVIQQTMRHYIPTFAQFHLILRQDFMIHGLTRANRHDTTIQAARRSMLARYRNFLLLSTLETWHQHVLWLDADVHLIPSDLPTIPHSVGSGYCATTMQCGNPTE